MAEGTKKFPLVMIISCIVVGLLLAGGVSYFIATKIVANKATVEDKKTHEPGEFIKLGDPKDGLILNLNGASGRFLKVGIILEIRPKKDAPAQDTKAISPEETKITDTVVALLRSQKIEDFDPSKQDKLKDLIKSEVNKTLGEDRVYDVYITNFVLQ